MGTGAVLPHHDGEFEPGTALHVDHPQHGTVEFQLLQVCAGAQSRVPVLEQRLVRPGVGLRAGEPGRAHNAGQRQLAEPQGVLDLQTHPSQQIAVPVGGADPVPDRERIDEVAHLIGEFGSRPAVEGHEGQEVVGAGVPA